MPEHYREDLDDHRPRGYQMNTETIAGEFVEQFHKAWSTSTVEELMALLTEDVVLIQPGVPSTRGKPAARNQFSRLLRMIPDLHVVVHRWAAREDTVFIEFSLVGTFGGRELSWPAVDCFLLRDGLAAERISYFDPMPLFLQVLKRPRSWRRLISSGFRPSFGGATQKSRSG
jgi:ketosteroid isomerase-like protein